MSTTLNLNERLAHQLNLSPQMLQSIQVLGLDIVDLHELVSAEVERNPLLSFPASWEPRASGASLIEGLTRAAAPGLRDDLRFQLHIAGLPAPDEAIGEYIIDCIDERGYLTEHADDLAQLTRSTPEAVARVLAVIRGFEPAGVAATDIRDCLLRQLEARPEPDACAICLVQSHLEDVARGHHARIALASGFSEEQVVAAVQLLRSLRLYPGENYGDAGSRWVLPEVLVAVEGNRLSVELCNELPPVQVDESLVDMAEGDPEATRYVRDALARASQLTHCLDQRRRTLLQVATAVIAHQQTHFLTGAPPVPLTLETIAHALGIAISTASRAISDRYFQFDRAVRPFRDLFPARLSSGASDALARQEIQRLIRQEEGKAPLSDQAIADALQTRGLPVARRTVAKYRGELGIETASRRRR